MMFLAAGPLLAAPKDDVKAAATALGDAANYSWQTAVVVPEGGFGASTSEGKTEKDGYTSLSLSSTFGDNTTTTQAFLKGTNGAVNSPDNGWQSFAEATQGGGGGGGFGNPGMFAVRQMQNLKLPAAEAANLAGLAGDLKADGDKIAGDLTADGAKSLLAFRGFGRRGGGQAPEVSNPKGTVTFWVADGKLTKYQFHVTGSMDFNGNAFDIDRTTTVTIKDVGTTKLDVPEDAKKKLQ